MSSLRRKQLVLVLGLMVLSTFAEVVSLGAVLPFIAVLAAPEKIFANHFAAMFAEAFGFTKPADLVLPITLGFMAIALVAGMIRMFLYWCNIRFSNAISADFSLGVYRRTLYQPYLVHASRNTSEVISSVIYNTNSTADALQNFLILVSSMSLILGIVVALVLIDPRIAIGVSLIFGSAYGIVTYIFRKRIKDNSKLIHHDAVQVIKALQEGLGAIREVLLDGNQAVYCDIYGRAHRSQKLAQGFNLFLSGSPRFVMEALGIILITSLAFYLSKEPGGVVGALPLLGALALGAQRILPALQQAYGTWTTILGSHAQIVSTLELLNQPIPERVHTESVRPLQFRESIRFSAVNFRYGVTQPWVFSGLDLVIPKGSRVGIVGSTGSGKSTMLDLLLGLIEPTEGTIVIDGEAVTNESRRMWQRIVAHVPQSIYLADASIAENIAFGVKPAEIDLNRVKEVARQAKIADFIESRPKGYGAIVGERGIRLSGGQRQRIGIARALYKQAEVLIFDEATSALDNATEQEVMDAIDGLHRDLTIIIVAHRLTTVSRCDKIIELEKGKVAAQGTYEYLLENSASFRNLANVKT